MAGSIPLRLQDTKQAAWADGKRDIFLVIYKQPDAELRELVGHDPVRPRVSSRDVNSSLIRPFRRFGLAHKAKWPYIGCIATLLTRRAP